VENAAHLKGRDMFKAILVNKDDQGYRAELSQVDETSLPEGDVRVKVLYSTLNYKDGLAITGKGPVVRSFPMVPGIDFAGEVLESASPEFKVGDMVLLAKGIYRSASLSNWHCWLHSNAVRDGFAKAWLEAKRWRGIGNWGCGWSG
jgi:NADPH:quinone reductase-like Zn-dependent oxidoreductase